MQKGRGSGGVVAGHRAQAPLAEEVGSSMSLLEDSGAAAHLGGGLFCPDRQLWPAPPLPLIPPPPACNSHLFLSEESTGGRVPCSGDTMKHNFGSVQGPQNICPPDGAFTERGTILTWEASPIVQASVRAQCSLFLEFSPRV